MRELRSAAKRRAVLGLMLCAALCPARAQEAPKPRVLKLLLLQDAPPLSHRDATGRFVGFNVDLGRLLCDTMRMPCEFQETVHTRVLDLVASGAVDIGMVSLIVTPERARQVLFTNPYRLSKTFWISRIPMTQSRQAKVAVVSGSVQHRWASRKRTEHGWELVPVAVNTDLAQALRDGRADALISPSSTALEIMREKDLSPAGLSARAIESDEFNNPIAIAVNPADPELRERLNAALQWVKTSGELDKINSKYYPFRVF